MAVMPVVSPPALSCAPHCGEFKSGSDRGWTPPKSGSNDSRLAEARIMAREPSRAEFIVTRGEAVNTSCQKVVILRAWLRIPVSLLILFGALGFADGQTAPSKEYIRLGSRVMAIENAEVISTPSVSRPGTAMLPPLRRSPIIPVPPARCTQRSIREHLRTALCAKLFRHLYHVGLEPTTAASSSAVHSSSPIRRRASVMSNSRAHSSLLAFSHAQRRS